VGSNKTQSSLHQSQDRPKPSPNTMKPTIETGPDPFTSSDWPRIRHEKFLLPRRPDRVTMLKQQLWSSSSAASPSPDFIRQKFALGFCFGDDLVRRTEGEKGFFFAMVSLSTWVRYAANKFEYSVSLGWKVNLKCSDPFPFWDMIFVLCGIWWLLFGFFTDYFPPRL